MALPFSILDVTNLLGIMPRNNKIISNCYDINCPFCGDDKYHLNVNLSKGVWRCPKCGEFGNAITMYAKYRGICNQDAYAEIIEGLNLDHLDKIEFQKRAKKREVEEKKILKSERNPKGDREYNQVFSALFKFTSFAIKRFFLYIFSITGCLPPFIIILSSLLILGFV